MNLFLERGFNAIIYDHRRHGDSGGKTTSFGHYEKFDLKAVIDWLKEEKGPTLTLGIHGESMGAATMLLYAGMLEDGADFYIADCPFSDLKEQVSYQLKKEFKNVSTLLIPIADFICAFVKSIQSGMFRPFLSLKLLKTPSYLYTVKTMILFFQL